MARRRSNRALITAFLIVSIVALCWAAVNARGAAETNDELDQVRDAYGEQAAINAAQDVAISQLLPLAQEAHEQDPGSPDPELIVASIPDVDVTIPEAAVEDASTAPPNAQPTVTVIERLSDGEIDAAIRRCFAEGDVCRSPEVEPEMLLQAWAVMCADDRCDGPPGDTGPQGETGETGPVGAIGPQGETGAQGRAPTADEMVAAFAQCFGSGQCIAPLTQEQANAAFAAYCDAHAGCQGPIGQTGEQGPVGAVGPPGPTGEPGPAGAAGVDGREPISAVAHCPAPDILPAPFDCPVELIYP